MYPSSYEPIEHSDYDHLEPMAERRSGSSWKTWMAVMLAIAVFALIFIMLGDPEAATETSQVLPDTPSS